MKKDIFFITLFSVQILPVVLLLFSNIEAQQFCGVFFMAVLVAFFTTGIGKWELFNVFRATLRIERRIFGDISR